MLSLQRGIRRSFLELPQRSKRCLGGAAVLRVFVDIKSPHAYLALGPTLEVSEDYACDVEWMPYELSYADLGVSTDGDLKDRVRRPPTAAGDRRARMYYRAVRHYAPLQGLSLIHI